MTQRSIAALLAVPLVVALLVAAWARPLPYVTYEPGLTVDVLAETNGAEIIQVDGHRTYRDDGELRMTTVYVSRAKSRIGLLELMRDWVSSDDAVYPYDAVYRPDETAEDSKVEGAVDMVSSQDAAIAVALTELGHDVQPAIEVQYINEGAPADGKLQVRDVFLKANGVTIRTPEDLVKAIGDTEPGEAVEFEVMRLGEHTLVSVVPEELDGRPQVGIRLGAGFIFPFTVSVNIDPEIGGPSAGLMFSLGIYDTLTPGSLTGGEIVAGTGTIDATGAVGPIGGIQQKIAASRAAGAELFMVPPDNCAEALGSSHDGVELVKATTMHAALEAIQAWVADHDAELPACEAS